MQKSYIETKGNRGAALVAVLMVALLLNFLFVAIFYSAKSTAKKSSRRRVNVTALNIAEAGKEHALSVFRSGSQPLSAGVTIKLFDSLAFGSGFYSVEASANSSVDTLLITSTGFLSNVSKSILVTCKIDNCPVPTDSAYNYGIIAGGKIDWTGSGECNTDTARIHTNSTFRITGANKFYCRLLSSVVEISMSGSSKIYGDAKAPSYDQSGSSKVTGAQIWGSVDDVPIPTIDLTPYYEHALANGQVFNGKTITGSSDLVIPGGIMWVNGEFKYSGSGDITGSIITTGYVKISGSGDFTAVNSYPAIVSRDDDIDMSGSGKVTGLIYARVGEIDKSGSGDVTGSMICGGDFDKSGSWNTLSYKKSPPVPPGCSGTSIKEVGWQELP